MRKILISFLGRKPAGKPYELTSYDFGDGQVKETNFFGLALAELEHPDLLLILGTAGSMWDVLIEHLANSDTAQSERLALIEAAECDAVRQPQLDQLQPLVEQSLGRRCLLRLIPYGRDEKQQVKILRHMAQDVAPGDQVYLDLTHGLRHLPMLGLLSALYLREARKARIEGVYYGAFDLKQDRKTPVLRLDGLLQVADWIRALAIYDHSGDYSVLGPLLQKEGLRGDFLERAAYYERILNPEKARQKLTGFPMGELRTKTIGGLFADVIEERIDWFKQPSRSAQERELAWAFFEKRDYMRAVAYAFEALATWLVETNGGNPADFDRRKELLDTFTQCDEKAKRLSRLRNELVHGSRTRNKTIQAIADDERQLRQVVDEFLRTYLPRG